MRTLIMLAVLTAAPSVAAATECWNVDSWTNQTANVTPIPCTNTPLTKGWIAVANQLNFKLRIDLNDPHVSSGFFWGHVTDWGVPGAPDFQWGSQYWEPIGKHSPDQATPVHGLLGRLRHVASNRCITPNGSDGGAVGSAHCTNSATMTYKLIDAGGGKFRLASHPSSKCLYVIAPGTNGGTVRNWSCWPDANMAFELAPDGFGGFYLRHQATNPDQCPYDAGTGVVNHFVCWDDPQMRYRFDAL